MNAPPKIKDWLQCPVFVTFRDPRMDWHCHTLRGIEPPFFILEEEDERHPYLESGHDIFAVHFDEVLRISPMDKEGGDA